VLHKSTISRGGSLFLIIFKLWYKMNPLTGKPRHERPPLPPQICLGQVLKMLLNIKQNINFDNAIQMMRLYTNDCLTGGLAGASAEAALVV